jgi:hypothetical protein
MGVASANAQVSIGGSSTDNPHEGAILDLKSANQGVLLPRVRLVDFEILTVGGLTEKASDDTAKGMTVYNTNAYALDGLGIYIWDGSRWNSIYAAGALAICESDYYLPDVKKTVDIPIPAGYNTDDKLTFLAYNLGANPNIAGQSATPGDIAKAQMGYGSADKTDITVFGGLYQWGRKDAKHALRCDRTSHPDRFTEKLYSSGKYNPDTDILFVWGNNTIILSADWVSDHFDADNRWGNGGGLAKQTDVSYNSGQPYNKSTNSNNPCPTGFRVPTQHEWALIGQEGGSPDTTTDDQFSTSASGTTPQSNAKVTWVPVKNAHASQAWESGSPDSWNNYSELNGFAIYSASVWNNAAAEYKDGTSSLADLAAPDPLMFLPAAGSRRTTYGQVGGVGERGIYWSSVVVGGLSSGLLFNNNLVETDGSGHRSDGQSVRCVFESLEDKTKEEEEKK